MQTAFEGTVPVEYGQAYLHLQGTADYSGEVRKGQVNGLLGAAVPTALFLTFGLQTGEVKLTIRIADTQPPLDDRWEEAVEASFTMPASAVLGLADWDGELWHPVPLAPGNYRVRYTALRFGEAENAPTPDDDADPIEQYEVVFWPAAIAPDAILKVTRRAAKYWHEAALQSTQSASNSAASDPDKSCDLTNSAEQAGNAPSLIDAATLAAIIEQRAARRNASFEYTYRELMERVTSVVPVERKTEIISLSEAQGRVTAEPVIACNNVPNQDTAIADGWAIRSAETSTASRSTPCRLRMSFSQRGGPIAEGETTRVFFGMAMPGGSDAVMATYYRDHEEDVEPSDIYVAHYPSDAVKVFAAVPLGSSVLRAGAEIERGQVLAMAGIRLSSAHVASAIAAGVQTVRVFVRPRVSTVLVPAIGDSGFYDITYEGRRNPASDLVQTTLQHWNANVIGTLEIPSDPNTARDMTQAVRELIQRSDVAITVGANGSEIRRSGYPTHMWINDRDYWGIRLSYTPRCRVLMVKCRPLDIYRLSEEVFDQEGKLLGRRMAVKLDPCVHVQLIGGVAATQLMTQLVLKLLFDAWEGVQDPTVDWQTGILSMDYTPAPGLPGPFIWMHASARDDGSTALQPVRIAEFSGTHDANAVAINPDAGPLAKGAALKYLRV